MVTGKSSQTACVRRVTYLTWGVNSWTWQYQKEPGQWVTQRTDKDGIGIYTQQTDGSWTMDVGREGFSLAECSSTDSVRRKLNKLYGSGKYLKR